MSKVSTACGRALGTRYSSVPQLFSAQPFWSQPMMKAKSLLVAMAVMLSAGIETAGFAQLVTKPPASDTHPRTDAEKIADALRGGPPFVTEHATILDFSFEPWRQVPRPSAGSKLMDVSAGGPDGRAR